MLQQLHENSVFGIWYLINNLTRQDAFDKEMVSWLIAFCGQSFCPSLTIVTTFWTGQGGMLRNQNQNLQQRLDEKWAQLQAFGAQHHAFGKRYANGIPQESTLSLFDPAERQELEQQASSMVTRYCHSELPSCPQILRELGEPRPLHSTSAGRVFRPHSQQGPRTASSEETGAATEASDAGRPVPPRQQREEFSFWSLSMEALEHAMGGLFRAVMADANEHSTRRPIYPGRAWSPPARAPHESGVFQQPALGSLPTNLVTEHHDRPNLDPLSSQDTAVLYGRAGDFGSRENYYNAWGLNTQYGEFTGTARQGNALRREMHNRWGQ